ncbi:hypothetical protein KR018_006515 [Drosophila ironensis]|nr:hypothetical protein KR018_006515 [Drosophila ironensis]
MAAKKAGTELVKSIAEFSGKSKGFDRLMKMIKITEGGEGRVLGEFTVAEEHLNMAGSLHGGLTATIVDNITTYALMSKGAHPGVTTTLNVSYMAPARVGDLVEVEATTIRAGKSLAYLDCILRIKENGKIIAKGGQVKYINFDK